MRDEFNRCLRRADRHARDFEWAEAGEAYAEAAHLAGMMGMREAAWRAWNSAGESWRRADTPRRAERALRRAYELVDPLGTSAGVVAVKLGAVLGDLGEPERASLVLEDFDGVELNGRVGSLMLDTRIGVLLSMGDRTKAARLVAELVGRDDAGAVMASGFRRGQIAALEGRLSDARQCFLEVGERMEADVGPAGLAAAHASLGELDLLEGSFRDAIGRFEEAAALHRELGRGALLWLAEAGRIRAMVELGVQPMVHVLDQGVRVAEAQSLVPLEVAIRTARGLAWCTIDPMRGEADLERAMWLADKAGLPMLAGQARYEWAVRLPNHDGARLAALEEAEEELSSSVPLSARAMLARARLLAAFDSGRARQVAEQAHERLLAAGLERDARLAALLMGQLPPR